MTTDALSRLQAHLDSHGYEHELVGGVVVVALKYGVKVKVNVSGADGAPVFSIVFGIVPMKMAIAFSVTVFSAMLVVAMALKDALPRYVLFLLPALFLYNAYFEFARYRLAQRTIADIRSVL